VKEKNTNGGDEDFGLSREELICISEAIHDDYFLKLLPLIKELNKISDKFHYVLKGIPVKKASITFEEFSYSCTKMREKIAEKLCAHIDNPLLVCMLHNIASISSENLKKMVKNKGGK